MGKDWDKFRIEKKAKPQVVELGTGMRKTTKAENQDFFDWVTVWGEQCLRVLKPGAFAFVMCSPRLDLQSRMALALEDAGFDISYTPIYWTYASGFPKAHNISKTIDKQAGAEREVVGKSKHNKSTNRFYGDNEDKFVTGADEENFWDITTPATPAAKELNGSYGGFQPKPAVEVIIVAMKPMTEKTFVAQALDNGKGITWLDDCRVPYADDDDRSGWHQSGADGSKGYNDSDTFKIREMNAEEIQERTKEGRFPANLLISDDILDDGKEHKSGKAIVGNGSSKSKHFGIDGIVTTYYGDSGTYSRFFSLDSWAERNLPFLIVPKASKAEKNKGLDNQPDRLQKRVNAGGLENEERWAPKMTKNNHPTVKPIKLMSYLIMMGSRPGDVVLDPFAGSGTTCCAAKELNRKYIGIELDPEYCKIAEARIKAWGVQRKLDFGN